MKRPKVKVSLNLLFKYLCKHKKEYRKGYMTGTPPSDWNWHLCRDCILCKLPWKIPNTLCYHEIVRDLCFAIWHERVLETGLKEEEKE